MRWVCQRKRKAKEKIVPKFKKLVEKRGGIHFDMPFALAYTGLEDTLLQKYIADSANLYEGQVARLPIYPIGSTIGTHAGPGAIAVAFFSND